MIFEPVVKIPTLYILPANHNAKTTKTIKRKIDKINCQSGTPKGSLAIIRIGEVKGNKLKNKDALLSGFSKITPINIKLAIIGSEIGNVN